MAEKKTLVIEKLYEPPKEVGGANLDLVLVHGLNGDPVESWTHDKTKICWPRDLLHQKLPQTRVFSFGYDADIEGNSSVAGIRGNARALLGRLRDHREDLKSRNPIVFLAHSLGGLIVKQALRIANNEPAFQSLATATRGLVFFGTPHAGGDRDQWLAVAKSFAPLDPAGRVSRLFSGTPGLVESLTNNSKDINDICDDFCSISEHYAIVSFYETKAFKNTKKPIVPPMSAKMNLPSNHEDVVPLDASHLDMCKFRDIDDQAFSATWRRIAAAGRGMVGAGRTRSFDVPDDVAARTTTPGGHVHYHVHVDSNESSYYGPYGGRVVEVDGEDDIAFNPTVTRGPRVGSNRMLPAPPPPANSMPPGRQQSYPRNPYFTAPFPQRRHQGGTV